MKKITSSIVAALAVSTFAFAGGDIAPVEPEVSVPEVVESTPGAFYVGLAYSYIKSDGDLTGTATPLFNPAGAVDVTGTAEADWHAVMLQAGYQFNPYLAVEGRYWTNVGTGDQEGTMAFEGVDETFVMSGDAPDIDAWGIYLKPMLPVGENFNVYALLGYGSVDIAGMDESGFQWGAGASYSFSDNLSLFVDYVSLYDDATTSTSQIYIPQASASPILGDFVQNLDQSIYSLNVGLTYKF